LLPMLCSEQRAMEPDRPGVIHNLSEGHLRRTPNNRCEMSEAKAGEKADVRRKS